MATELTAPDLGRYGLVRLQELDGFIEGLFNGEDVIDLPERAHEAVGHLAEMRAMMAGICELVSGDPHADDRTQLDTTFRHLRELTRIMETEIHEAVLSCTRARRQMIEGILNINGQPVKRERIADYVTADNWGRSAPTIQYRETLPNGVSHQIIEREGDTGTFDNTQVFTVPPGHFFMMGDNRDNSLDSRDRSVGFVPFENFVGRAEIIFFSIEDGASAWKIWEWPYTVRWNRLFSTIK
jgi:type IV secretory pathway protease TraF